MGSNGYFKFKIDQVPNNPDGTVIYNDAAIYFDFNPPIITNEVFHTIGRDFINRVVVSVNQLDGTAPVVRVYPNPFAESATFDIEQMPYSQLELQVFSAAGQLLRSERSSGTNRLVLARGALPSGVYFYRLVGDAQLLSTGKLLLK
jgi:hypothetical protein